MDQKHNYHLEWPQHYNNFFSFFNASIFKGILKPLNCKNFKASGPANPLKLFKTISHNNYMHSLELPLIVRGCVVCLSESIETFPLTNAIAVYSYVISTSRIKYSMWKYLQISIYFPEGHAPSQTPVAPTCKYISSLEISTLNQLSFQKSYP